MKSIFKTLLLTIFVFALSGCEDWLGKNTDATIYAEINGVPHEGNYTDLHAYIHEEFNENDKFVGDYSFSFKKATILSKDGSEAHIDFEFKDKLKVGTKCEIHAFIGHNLEPGYYKSFDTSDGWVEITNVQKRFAEIVRVEGKFEFCVKYPNSDEIEVNVTNGRFSLPKFR